MSTDTPAQAAARAWLHSYGVDTEAYRRDGADHPAMPSLSRVFEEYRKRHGSFEQRSEVMTAPEEMR